jgi:DNA repair protein RadA/Sms
VITPKEKRGFLNPQPPRSLKDIQISASIRTKTGIGEFDRVMGGGIVAGSLVLIGGEPGIGKSTLILQATNNLANKGNQILYCSGEESREQIKLRAERMGIVNESLYILSEIDIERILREIENLSPKLVVIDSIQTVYRPDIDNFPGSVVQVRECASNLIKTAKGKRIPVFIIGHVTKGGVIAGPRTLEHMVDTVLYLEGDRNHFFRILRAAKNRFGSTNEIGVFEMGERGLMEVKDPSLVFLEERNENLPGVATVCSLEGTRPFLVEVQALVSKTSYGMPQRVVSGVDYRRFAMLIAVCEKKLGIRLGAQDVFLNIVGGLRIEETASDLGIVCAIVSAYRGRAIDRRTIIIGEVGLTGEVRSISQLQKRVNEAERLGFKRCIVPRARGRIKSKIEIVPVHKVSEALDRTVGSRQG